MLIKDNSLHRHFHTRIIGFVYDQMFWFNTVHQNEQKQKKPTAVRGTAFNLCQVHEHIICNKVARYSCWSYTLNICSAPFGYVFV